MSALTRSALHLLTAAIFCCGSAALAMPKAAEHEDAQVTTGVDTAKPKRASLTAQPTAKPTPAAKKSAHAGKAKSTHKTKPAGKSKSASQAKPAAKAGKSATSGKGSRASK